MQVTERTVVSFSSAVSPEHEIVFLLSHQAQVERGGLFILAGLYAYDHGIAVSHSFTVNLENTTINFYCLTVIGCVGIRSDCTALHPLRNGDGNCLSVCSVGSERSFLLLTCGKSHNEAHYQ